MGKVAASSGGLLEKPYIRRHFCDTLGEKRHDLIPRMAASDGAAAKPEGKKHNART